jgi:hypothetical protein
MPRPDFYVKQGDLLPDVVRLLEDADAVPVDISAASSVMFKMQPIGGGSVISGTAVVHAATVGQVTYSWEAGDTDVAGFYLAEWEVRFSGNTETFPNGGYDVVLITEDL